MSKKVKITRYSVFLFTIFRFCIAFKIRNKSLPGQFVLRLSLWTVQTQNHLSMIYHWTWTFISIKIWPYFHLSGFTKSCAFICFYIYIYRKMNNSEILTIIFFLNWLKTTVKAWRTCIDNIIITKTFLFRKW